MTIAGLYAFLRETAGGFLAKAGKSTEPDGSGRVPDLDGPIARALRRNGTIPADDTTPVDGDLVEYLDGGKKHGLRPYVEALAAAETFVSVAGWLAKVDQAIGPSNQKLSQYIGQALDLAKWWEDRATALGPNSSAPASCNAHASRMDDVPLHGAGGLASRYGYPEHPWGRIP